MNAQSQQTQFFEHLRSGPGFIGWKPHDSGFGQRWFADEAEALALIERHGGRANVWVSMAEFPNGREGRVTEKARRLKAFWLDVDAHGKGKYATPGECCAGIRRFVEATGLPRPNYIHGTGHGVQALWALPLAISRSDWQPVADALQKLAKAHELGADPITADPARILRVPGTFNFRNPENPRPTELFDLKHSYTELAALMTALEGALAMLPPTPAKPTKAAASQAARRAQPKGHLLFSKRVDETPRQRARVAEMLAHISADCTYGLYRNIVWAVLSLGWEDSEELAQQWCQTAPERFEEDNFSAVVNSHDATRSPTIGTIIHHARAGG